MCIYELVKMKDEIKKVIHQNVEMAELKEKTKGKFIPFRKNCIDRVLSGETSIEEVLKSFTSIALAVLVFLQL